MSFVVIRYIYMDYYLYIFYVVYLHVKKFYIISCIYFILYSYCYTFHVILILLYISCYTYTVVIVSVVHIAGSVPDVVPRGVGITAIALYDYEATDDDELSFDPNDIISDIEKVTII